MASYTFSEKIVNIPGALDKELTDTLSFATIYQGLSTDPLVVNFLQSLTETQQTELETLINVYVDPAQFLTLDHTESHMLHSHFIGDCSLNNDNCSIFQTFIFNGVNSNTSAVLDGAKSVLEINCPNVQNYLNTTTGSLTLSINDLTRNVNIASQNVNIDDVLINWNTLAATGSTLGNTQYKTVQYSGLVNKNPGFDCIWQIVGTHNDDPKFDFRSNSLQFLYYNIQTS